MKVLLFALVAIVSSHVYFHENFNDDTWAKRWIVSDWKQDSGEAGEWTVSPGKYFADETEDRGLKTTQDARFYAISSAFKEFSNKGKDLVVSYSVKHEQNIDCGGGYIKLLPAGLELKEFKGGESESKYNIMFGPDICGSTRRVHVILHNKGTNHLIKKNIAAETDVFSHVYTLVLSHDNSYKVYIDGDQKESGKLDEDWDILPPKKIKDPKLSKPSDWVDTPTMDDPEDVKPEGWDDIPAEIADPEATKPEDWDEELDGEWEAPSIPNPDFKGPWTPKRMPNPKYQGEWVHPEIDNPAYTDDPELYKYDSFGVVGIDIWQVKSGTIFDEFMIADDYDDVKDSIEKINKRRETEKELKEADDVKQTEAATSAAHSDDAAGDAEDGEAEKDDHEDGHSGHDHGHDHGHEDL
jgi:calreticulin